VADFSGVGTTLVASHGHEVSGVLVVLSGNQAPRSCRVCDLLLGREVKLRPQQPKEKRNPRDIPEDLIESLLDKKSWANSSKLPALPKANNFSTH
jgi:hypothetical protein